MHEFTNYTSTKRLKLTLRIPGLEVTLCERLLLLKEKYTFNEEFYLLDKCIEKIEQENAIKLSINN